MNPEKKEKTAVSSNRDEPEVLECAPSMTEEELEELYLEETTLRQEGRIVVTSFV